VASKLSLFLAELKRRKVRPAEVVYVVVLTLGAVFPIPGQDLTELRVGRTIEGELTAGGRHAFLVDLNPSQVVFGEVDQISVDVVVTVLLMDAIFKTVSVDIGLCAAISA